MASSVRFAWFRGYDKSHDHRFVSDGESCNHCQSQFHYPPPRTSAPRGPPSEWALNSE